MKTLRIPFTLLCVLAISTLSAHVAHASQLATAKVISVEGTVTKHTTGGIKLHGRERQLKVGDILSEGDSVNSSADSQAFLVFSNGSEITITENTSVKIAELEQEPYGSSQTYEQLQADPSKSQTLLELNYGQLDGHVKKLSEASSFKVKTPLGTAAIRGTKFSVKLVFDKDTNKFELTIRNLDGMVDFIGQGRVVDYLFDDAKGDPDKMKNEFDDGSLIEATTLPEQRALIIICGQENKVYEAIIEVLAVMPGIDVAVADDGNITVSVDAPDDSNEDDKDPLPPPVITPEDPGIIVVSPEDQG